jgi:hypothetical protein
LTPTRFDQLVRFVVKKGWFDPDVSDCETPEEYLKANCWPFEQAIPDEDCPDPACGNHGQRRSLRTLAIFEEDERNVRALWGPNCGSLQIIYQVCPKCGAIRTTNQCT